MDFKQETARKIQRWHAEISQECAPFQSKCAARDQKCSPRASILDTNLLKLNQQPVYYRWPDEGWVRGTVVPVRQSRTWCDTAARHESAVLGPVTSSFPFSGTTVMDHPASRHLGPAQVRMPAARLTRYVVDYSSESH